MTAPDPTAGEREPSPSTLWPHGPIVGHPKHDYYVCGSCHGPLGPGPCPAKMPTQPNPPTFDSLLSDPTQQLDSEGVVIASIPASPPAVAASTGTSEDVEALAEWLYGQSGGIFWRGETTWQDRHREEARQWFAYAAMLTDRAAREAAARAEERERIAQAIEVDPGVRLGHNVSVICSCLRCEVAHAAARIAREVRP